MSARPLAITVSPDRERPWLERHGEPVAIGVALPRGEAQRSQGWSLSRPDGRRLPVQTTPLDRWGDGSVRWLLVEFAPTVTEDTDSRFILEPAGPRDIAGVVAEPLPPGHELTVTPSRSVLTVRTGAAEFDVARFGPGVVSTARVDGRSLLLSSAIEAEDARGIRYTFSSRQSAVERLGPVSTTIRLDGALLDSELRPWLETIVRLRFFANLGVVRVEVSITNPRAARHARGTWDLGDSGSVLIKELTARFELAGTTERDVWASLDSDEEMRPAGDRVWVYQDSSGGPGWNHVNHVTRDNVVPSTFRGFKAIRQDQHLDGLRATPVVSVGSGLSCVSVAVPRFWELFPKSLSAGPRQFEIGMFPRESAVPHELQGGERSTLSFMVCVGRDTISAEPLAWTRSPLRVCADPESYRIAGVWAPVTAGSPASHATLDHLAMGMVEGSSALVRRRETVDEYGWRHYGELYADHESVGRNPAIVSHYNNQYDAVAGFATRFVQTSDPRWFTLMDDLAGHVSDIDLYHTGRDRAAYNGGYFWHTEHFLPAGSATHRAYSKRNGSAGGGPSAEHNYSTGLLLHHLLTGSERSRAAVLQLANWVLDMDDGRKSRFRWIDRHDTGLASGTRSLDFHGPGRGAGNSINALLDAHRLTAEPKYLAKAEALVARCVHPDDAPETLDLLDAENRWSYTVFLQAVGKYLEHRADRGLFDERFEYARAVLIKYATWMGANERPYLDAPERLEYPTETWAAQDLRKAAVFEFAARHAESDVQRALFEAQADRFVDYAIPTLHRMPTGRLTRPLVLLLAYGFQRPLAHATVAHALRVSMRQTRRSAFTPLRQRVLRRLALAGAGLSAAVVVILLLIS